MDDHHPLRSCLIRLQSEIDASLTKEGDYVAKITELSTSLSAFTEAYSRSREDIACKDKKIAALENELQALKGHEQRVICLLDGDGAIFSPDLITQGQEGGLEAARLLIEQIRLYLLTDLGHDKFQVWVYLFYNKRGLFETFGRVGLSATRLKFDDFIIGFNQASERFLMVDVGGSKEAADAKIKVHLQDNIRLPQTQRIIFGGSHDNGYVNILRSVITDGFRTKLILMPGYSEVAVDIKALGLPELRIPNLFISTKLVPPSYTSVALAPPPGLPTTPRLPLQNPQMSNSNMPTQDISNLTPGRDSIHNHTYKSALQSGRNDAVSYEPSDSSGGSPDANDAHPAQFIQFTRRASSPGKPRRLNPKLVECIPLYQRPTDSVFHLLISPYRSIFQLPVLSFTFNNAGTVRTADMVMIIFWKTNITKNLEQTPKRHRARFPMKAGSVHGVMIVFMVMFALKERPVTSLRWGTANSELLECTVAVECTVVEHAALSIEI